MLAERIYSCVRSVISTFGLLGPEELAGCLNLYLLKVPLNAAHGMMVHETMVPLNVLAVDASLPLPHQRGVILHECGHHVLHGEESRFFLEQSTLYLPDRKEMEADLFALFYLQEWDKLGFEECGGDLLRFADFYGLPRRAAEAAAFYYFGERLCG